MQLDRLAETWTAVSATRSRNAKRDLLAATLAAAEPGDLEIAVSYLAGMLRQRRPGLGWRGLATLPDSAAEASLTLRQVDATFEAMAGLSGPGSANRRSALAADLFGRATEQEQAFLRGLVLGDLRQGAMDALVQEGMARAFGVDPVVMRRAAMLLSSTTEAAHVLATGGAEALAAVGLAVGTPIQPMLAASAPTPRPPCSSAVCRRSPTSSWTGSGCRCIAEGTTCESSPGRWTRSPSGCPRSWRPSGRSRPRSWCSTERCWPYGPTGDRSPSSWWPPAPPPGPPGRSSAWRCGCSSSTCCPWTGARCSMWNSGERAAELERLLPPELRVERTTVTTVEELTEVFDSAVARGFEGVVVKQPTAGYVAGRRQASWIKVKPRHTLDLLVTGVEWGYGRREGWLSNIHLAARDAATGEPVMLGKTFKGMTDELLRWQTEHFESIATSRDSTPSRCGRPLWSRSRATACSSPPVTRVAWRCGSRACFATGRTRTRPKPTPSMTSSVCWVRRWPVPTSTTELVEDVRAGEPVRRQGSAAGQQQGGVQQ